MKNISLTQFNPYPAECEMLKWLHEQILISSMALDMVSLSEINGVEMESLDHDQTACTSYLALYLHEKWLKLDSQLVQKERLRFSVLCLQMNHLVT